MNPVSQSDLHPGAESLNAFAEQALAGHEREQVLAHLAKCSRCREVMYLAQAAAAEPESPSTNVAAARRGPLTASWFANWRIAWVPAATLAAAAALAILIHVRHIEQQTEMATVTPERLAQSERAVAPPAPLERPEAAPSPASPAPGMTAQPNRKSAPPNAESQPSSQQALASAALSSQPEATLQSESIAPPGTSPENTAVPPGASRRALPAVGAAYPFNLEQTQSRQLKTEAAVAGLQQGQDRAQARTYGAELNQQPTSAKSPMAPAQMRDANPASTTFIAENEQLKMAGVAGGRIMKPAPLPSGLTAISTVDAGARCLAIDSAGTLFLSENSGSTWKRIARQWTGRAVAVNIRPVLSSNTSVAPANASEPGELMAAAPSAPAIVFEIVNDKGRTWSSIDGRTWTAQ